MSTQSTTLKMRSTFKKALIIPLRPAGSNLNAAHGIQWICLRIEHRQWRLA